MEAQTKKTLLKAIVWTAGGILLVAFLWYAAFMGQFDVYKDNTYGFSVKYPRQWQKVVNAKAGAAVAFVSPKENALDVFRENVNITVQDVPMDLASIKAYANKTIEQMSKVFNNIKVVEAKPITFGGHMGYRLLFAADKPDAVRILVAMTIKGGQTAYIFMYMATANKYKAYLPLVEEMIKSFQLR